VTAKPAQSFSDLEAVKIALGMEKDGLAFYQAAAGASPPGELRSTFEMLADEERKHLAIFEDMAGEMARAKREDYWDDPDVEAYVHAVVGQKIFPRPDLAPQSAAGMSDAADALRFALQAEKDTVLYYTLCSQQARGNEVRSAFNRLTAEERRHVALMGRLLAKAKGDGG
jgi:rubrerythrin